MSDSARSRSFSPDEARHYVRRHRQGSRQRRGARPYPPADPPPRREWVPSGGAAWDAFEWVWALVAAFFE